MKSKTLLDVIIILYIILFLYTGISKILDYTVFKEQITAAHVPEPLANLIAMFLPWVEFSAVLLLIVPRWRLKGLYASLILMSAFTGYIIYLISFVEKLPCSCGGVIELLTWKEHIIFNTTFIALSVSGILIQKSLQKKERLNWKQIMPDKSLS